MKYKRCDEAFKRSAVERLLVSGKLGVNEQSLAKWKQQFKALTTESLPRNGIGQFRSFGTYGHLVNP
jgi:transposase-like protein